MSLGCGNVPERTEEALIMMVRPSCGVGAAAGGAEVTALPHSCITDWEDCTAAHEQWLRGRKYVIKKHILRESGFSEEIRGKCCNGFLSNTS